MVRGPCGGSCSGCEQGRNRKICPLAICEISPRRRWLGHCLQCRESRWAASPHSPSAHARRSGSRNGGEDSTGKDGLCYVGVHFDQRSEERRVGKECRSWRPTYDQNIK